MKVKFQVLEVQKQKFTTKGGPKEQEVAVMQDVTDAPSVQLFEWVFPEHSRPQPNQVLTVRVTQIEQVFNGRARIQCVPVDAK